MEKVNFFFIKVDSTFFCSVGKEAKSKKLRWVENNLFYFIENEFFFKKYFPLSY